MSLPGTLLPWVELRFAKTIDGFEPNAGGFVEFRESDLTTPQDTYTTSDVDPATGIPNPNPIELDADGRPPDPIYLAHAAYSVFVSDSDNVPLYDIPFVEDVGATFMSSLGNIQAEGSKDVATSPYLVTAYDNLVTFDSIVVDTVCQLPPASSRTQAGGNGNLLCIKNVGASADVLVTPDGTDTIDNSIIGTAYIRLPAALGVPAYAPSILLASDGVSGWFVLASHGLQVIYT